jgi:hypothetical protein
VVLGEEGKKKRKRKENKKAATGKKTVRAAGETNGDWPEVGVDGALLSALWSTIQIQIHLHLAVCFTFHLFTDLPLLDLSSSTPAHTFEHSTPHIPRPYSFFIP